MNSPAPSPARRVRTDLAPGFTWQRLSAVLLIALQAGLLWKLMDGMWFAMSGLLLAVVALWVSADWMLPRFNLVRVGLGVIALFALKAWKLPHSLSSSDGFLYSEYAYEICCGLIAMQVILLWAREHRTRLPFLPMALAGMCLVFLGDSRISDGERVLTSVVASAYCILAALFAANSRRTAMHTPQVVGRLRTILWVIPVIIGTLVGQVLAVGLYRNEQAIEQWLAKAMDNEQRSTRNGYNGEVSLGSGRRWQSMLDEVVVLRVEGARTEQYLAGHRMQQYSRRQWANVLIDGVVTPMARPQPDGRSAFQLLGEPLDMAAETLDVWPEHSVRVGTFFLPSKAARLTATAEVISLDAGGNTAASPLATTSPYRVETRATLPAMTLTNEERTACLHLSTRLDPYVRELAAQLFEGCETTPEKIARVEDYFQRNHQYQLGIHIPEDTDPLGYFLREKQAAHCEYFATASALLLRVAGVPTRLVVGYLATEWNATAGLLIVRQKDAHAWTEAYDEKLGQWLLVEATPGGGVPAPRTTEPGEAWRQWIKHRFALTIAAWKHMTLLELVQTILLWLPLTLLSVVVLVGVVASLRWFMRWRRSLKSAPVELIAAELKAGRRDLFRALARRGWKREPAETLHQLADRVEQASEQPWGREAAECCRLYATLRFGPPTEGGTQELARLLEAL
ncbi:MAG: transglutaminase domain-containing protein [Planctomycetaceae bacterium]|nr:transglutaminase domain-containing protein [Planctomycetaceae bacterium]